MSRTKTEWVATGGVSQVSETNLRNNSGWESREDITEESKPFVSLTFNSQEEILAFLTADPPKKALVDTKSASAIPQLGAENEDSSMLRNQSIAALKRELSELNINADDELFKSSSLNVGKYVVGPMPEVNVLEDPNACDMITSQANRHSDEQSITAVNEIITGSDLLGAGAGTEATAVAVLTNSDSDEDLAENVEENVDVEANGNLDEHVDHLVAQQALKNTGESAGKDSVEDVPEDGGPPRVPPNTPAVKERIWWKNEFLVIKKSKLGGLGAFAAKDLSYGDIILEEMPLLRTNNWGICNEYDYLSDEDKQLFHSLHKFSTNPTAHDIEKIRRANSFQLPKGVAIYSVTSRFNHACLPVRNVNYRINSRADAEITLTALKAVPKGTELTICYGGKPEQLLRGFGFRCQCGGCNPLTDKEAEDIMKAWRGNGNWSNKW